MPLNALIGNKSVFEASSLHCSSAKECMCYSVYCCNVYQDAIYYSLSCYQTHSSWSSFKKSGYDAVERAFTKVDMENFVC